jgi:riboflavin kinase/FMN adenylyltransferase
VRNAGRGRFRLWPSACSAARTIAGRCCTARKLARQLGTPTANIQLKRRRVPLTGVYLVSVDIDGKPGPASPISASTHRCGDGKAHLEVHLLDFAGDLYGRR